MTEEKKPDRSSKEKILIATTILISISFGILFLFAVEVLPFEKSITHIDAEQPFGIYTFENGTEFFSTGLFGEEIPLNEEVKRVNEIFSDIPMHCYNLDWYKGGTQVFLIGTMEAIDVKLGNLNRIEFYNNPIVMKYIELHCPHIDTTVTPFKELPPVFDPELGITAYKACMISDYDENYCQTIKEYSESVKFG